MQKDGEYLYGFGYCLAAGLPDGWEAMQQIFKEDGLNREAPHSNKDGSLHFLHAATPCQCHAQWYRPITHIPIVRDARDTLLLAVFRNRGVTAGRGC
jgi:hypothetical protein